MEKNYYFGREENPNKKELEDYGRISIRAFVILGNSDFRNNCILFPFLDVGQ